MTKKHFLAIFIPLILAILITILTIIAKIYIWHNLTYYSVYYAQHMPHKEGTRPEMVMILENLEMIEKPENGWEGQEEPPKPDKLWYDFDGHDAVHLDNKVIGKIAYSDGYYEYRMIFLNSGTVYNFRENGEFKNIEIKDYDENGYGDTLVYTGPEYEAQAQTHLDQLLNLILEVQPTPKINLQKLFNKKYEKLFND